MLWFKHYVTASHDPSVRRVKAEFGYHGLGIFWCIVERVAQCDGKILATEIEREFMGHHFNRGKVRSLITNSGFFVTDDAGCLDLMDPTMYKNSADNGQTARTCDLATKKDKEKIRKEKKTSSEKDTSCSMAALLSEAADDKEKTFYETLLAKYPRICQMRDPLSYAQMQQLQDRFGHDEVLAILNDMENYPKLIKQYLSANLTVQGWLRARAGNKSYGTN